MKTIRLTNASAEISFDLGEKFEIEGAEISVSSIQLSDYIPRVEPQPRYGRSGGVNTGDGEIPPRTLTMMMDITTEEFNDHKYQRALASFLGFFRLENAPHFLNDDQDDTAAPDRIPRRIQIALSREGLVPGGNDTGERWMQGPIIFSAPEAMWEDQNPQTFFTPSGGISDQDTFIVTNDGFSPVFPIFRINAFALNSLFRITNLTTDVYFEIGTTDFFPGQELEVNTVTGKILINEVAATVSALSEGSSFPLLLPGANTFRYSSAFSSVDVEIEFRRTWPR